MKRRLALKHILMATTTAAMLPSCLFDKKKKENLVSLKHFSMTENQQQTIAAVSDTLIPETDIVGAKSIGAYVFVLTMVDDCYDKKAQEAFVKGIDEVDAIADKTFNKSFAEALPSEREEILKKIDAKKIDSPTVQEFYRITKRHTIQAFLTCEDVMTKIKGYEFVPGRFNGCVPIKTA